MLTLRLPRLFLAALLLATPAFASAGVRPWISVAIGGSTYAMDDVNDEVAAINAALAGSGLSMEKVSSGFNFGLALGLDVGSGFAVGIGYDQLMASTDVGDFSGSLEYDLPANQIRGFGRYTFQSAGKAGGFLEASVGHVKSAGSITVAATGYGSQSADIDGSGTSFEGAAGVSLWAAPQFAFTGMAGYRHAELGDVTVEGMPVVDATGGDYTIDYSGLFARVGFTVALTR